MQSCVLIIAAALKAEANAFFFTMGWADADDDSFSVPLAAGGAGDPTHWGLHTWAKDRFVTLLEEGKAGVMPAKLSAASYPAEDFAEVMTGLIVSFGTDPATNFAGVLEVEGLTMIAE